MSLPPHIKTTLQFVPSGFAIVGGVAGVAQLASTTSTSAWLLAAVGVLGLISVCVLVAVIRPHATPVQRSKTEAGIGAVAVLGVIASAIFVGTALFGSSDPPAMAPPAVTITEPKFIEGVPYLVPVRGTAPGLRSDESIWVLSGKISDSNVYLHGKPCRDTPEDPGTWVCEPWDVGEPYPTVDKPSGDAEGTAYRIFAIRVDADTTRYFEGLWSEHSAASVEREAAQTEEQKVRTQVRLDAAWAKMVFSARQPGKIDVLPVDAKQIDQPVIVQREPQPAS